MRIASISDTHGQHRSFTKSIPDCDLLIHAGDFMYSGWELAEIRDFDSWLGELPAKEIIVVAGNHDVLFEKEPDAARKLLTNAHYLQESGLTINGLTIWGSPFTPRFYDWAFMSKRGEEMRRHWDRIPKNTNILVTHGPPKSVLDMAEGIECGCEELLLAVVRVEPEIHVFGHIHSGHGRAEIGKTRFINAAVLDELYSRAYEPIVIEVPAEGAPSLVVSPPVSSVIGR